jgi:NDP-sugar pyrophosphorylase family protein
MQAVILCGGLATRLGSLTADCPKSMVQVCGHPFIDYQLDLIRANGLTEVILCVGYLAHRIEEYLGNGKRNGVNITYSREERPLGTAGAVKNAQRHIKGDFLTLYGDSYLDIDYQEMISFFEGRNKLALMMVYKNRGRYDASNAEIEGEVVTRYDKVEKTPGTVYIDYGASIFRWEVLDWLPGNQSYSLSELFQRLIEQKELLAYEVAERFYEIGSPAGLDEFRRLKGGRHDSIARAR